MGTISDAQMGTRAVRRMMSGCRMQAVHHDHDTVENQNVQKSLEAVRDQRRYRRSDKCNNRPEVRNELQSSGQNRPEEREGHVQVPQPGPPQRAYREGVVALRDEPPPEGFAGDVDVPGELHWSFHPGKRKSHHRRGLRC